MSYQPDPPNLAKVPGMRDALMKYMEKHETERRIGEGFSKIEELLGPQHMTMTRILHPYSITDMDIPRLAKLDDDKYEIIKEQVWIQRRLNLAIFSRLCQNRAG